MLLKSLMLATAAALVVGVPLAVAQSPSTVPVRFRAHDIAEIRGEYAVAVADFNNDGRLDVIANSLGVRRSRGMRIPRGNVT